MQEVGVRKQWLVSRLSTGWTFGVHPSWKRMQVGMRDRLRLQDEDPLPASHKRTATLGQGKVYYTTLLREPVARVLSEWCFLLHSSSNTPLSGWSAWNDGLRADRPNIPRIPSDSPCTNNTALVPQPARCELYMPRTVSGEKFSCESFLSGISKGADSSKPISSPPLEDLNEVILGLEQFLNCTDNAAMNRQVRMLANRRCNNGTSVHYVDNEALHTAQHTLQNEMPYFGLYSELHLSEQLFTAVFGGYFSGVEQHNTSLTRYRSYQGSHAHDKTDFSQEMLAHLPFELIRKLQRNNLYDIELYKFAHALFSERLRSNGFA